MRATSWVLYDAVLSLDEMFGRAGERQPEHDVLEENDIVDGIDELGVLFGSSEIF